MRVVNCGEVMDIINEKQTALRTDGDTERSVLAKEVADWGINQLEQVKEMIKAMAFDVTFSQYKSGRNGDG